MPEDNGSGDGGNGQQSGEGQQQQQNAGGYKPPASQEEFDRIIASRVQRTKDQFKDYSDLQAKAAEFDKQQAANQTELQRAQAERDTERERATVATQRAVTAEVKAIATGEFEDPADVAAFLDLSKYLGKKGDVDPDAIEADLKDLLKRKPYLAAKNTRTDVGTGVRGNGTTQSPNQQMNDHIRRAAGR